MEFLEDFLELLACDDMTGIVLDVKKEKDARFLKLNFN
jgi:hypothetical protein